MEEGSDIDDQHSESENKLFSSVVSSIDGPFRDMQLRRKSSIILDRQNIDAEDICIEDVGQDDWDFFDGLTTPRHTPATALSHHIIIKMQDRAEHLAGIRVMELLS